MKDVFSKTTTFENPFIFLIFFWRNFLLGAIKTASSAQLNSVQLSSVELCSAEVSSAQLGEFSSAQLSLGQRKSPYETFNILKRQLPQLELLVDHTPLPPLW